MMEHNWCSMDTCDIKLTEGKEDKEVPKAGYITPKPTPKQYFERML